MDYEAVIGLEVHAELQTRSKMFCGCQVVDSTIAQPNISVCPICAGMPGVLPVANRRAVEYGLQVALALECQVNLTSIFARKNYFYPDLPKGYQISQYEQPLARHGRLVITTSAGERVIRIRRVHLEEDTGKLTHIEAGDQAHSLVDLNRAGVPLLEIVSEPDLHSAAEVRVFATALRSVLQYLRVNSGDMQKGVMRIEPNISVRPVGSDQFGTRTEIKNLNSFRALERSVEYEIQRQTELVRAGRPVLQETRGWDETRGVTFTQRVKEGEDDYRYFQEPDLPPLVVSQEWLDEIKSSLPELPVARQRRFQEQYQLNEYDTEVLTAEPAVADYFEAVVLASPATSPKVIANWITGDLFGLLNKTGVSIEACPITSTALAELLGMVVNGSLNQNTAKTVLAEMFASAKTAAEITSERGLSQISDTDEIASLVLKVLEDNPEQVADYLSGKEALSRWLFGQVMRAAHGQANPQVVQAVLDRALSELNHPRQS